MIGYVGYDARHLNAIIVGHQGTNPSSLFADFVNMDFIHKPLDLTLFPGLSLNIKAHEGFLGTHSHSMAGVLASVSAVMANTRSTTVWIVGHSLGE